jgi:hypothetical protein
VLIVLSPLVTLQQPSQLTYAPTVLLHRQVESLTLPIATCYLFLHCFSHLLAVTETRISTIHLQLPSLILSQRTLFQQILILVHRS